MLALNVALRASFFDTPRVRDDNLTLVVFFSVVAVASTRNKQAVSGRFLQTDRYPPTIRVGTIQERPEKGEMESWSAVR